MKVSELISLLLQEDQDRIVVMSKDSEGNYYSPLWGCWTGSYVADSSWSGEIGLERLTERDIISGYTEEDVRDGVPALILTPIN